MPVLVARAFQNAHRPAGLRSRSWLLVAALVGACSASPDHGGADAGTPAADGGQVDGGPAQAGGGVIMVRVAGEGIGLLAEVFSQASATPNGPGAPGSDCTVTPRSASATQTITVTDLDLGPSVTLTTSAGTLSAASGTPDLAGALNGTLPGDAMLAVVHQGPVVVYQDGLVLSSPPFEGTWSLANAGAATGLPAGTLASGTFPGHVIQDPTFMTNGSVTSGEAATVTWTGGAGAQVFHLLVSGADAAADCYAGPGATDFTVPATITQAVGAGAYILVAAQRSEHVEIGGQQVLVVTQSDNLD